MIGRVNTTYSHYMGKYQSKKGEIYIVIKPMQQQQFFDVCVHSTKKTTNFAILTDNDLQHSDTLKWY